MKLPVVLNTRPKDQAAELSRLLEEAGFIPVEAPAIATVDTWDPAEVRAATYTCVVLASANAARRIDLTGARVLCGAATAAALGITADIALERFSAEAALRALSTQLSRGDRVLLPRAEEGRTELVDGLRDLGVEVDAPVVYRTVALPDAADRLARGDIDVVTLCSPSAARSIGRVERARVACLGATTADAARELGIRVDAVAPSTSMAALVMAVRSITRGVTV